MLVPIDFGVSLLFLFFGCQPNLFFLSIYLSIYLSFLSVKIYLCVFINNDFESFDIVKLIFPFLRLFLFYLSIYLSIYLIQSAYISLSLSLSLSLSPCHTLFLSVSVSLSLYIYIYIYIYTCIKVLSHLSIYLSIYFYVTINKETFILTVNIVMLLFSPVSIHLCSVQFCLFLSD